MRKVSCVFLAVACFAAALLTGCGQSERGGAVALRFGMEDARSILPPISMTPASYTVSATGPAGATYGPEVFTADATVADFVPGEWTFSAVAKNGSGHPIGEGSCAIEVLIGQTVGAELVVHEYTTPDGAFALGVSWQPDIVADPVWTGSLKDFASVTTSLVFDTDEVECTAETTVDPLHAGWFALIVKLFDAPLGMDGSEVLSTGAATAVRIAAGETTTGTLDLHAVQGYGQIALDFQADFADPLLLDPSVAFGAVELYSGEEQAFGVTADVACTSVYYLRGQQVGTETFTLDADDLAMPGEAYRLDVIAFSVDGSRAASDTWLVSRTEGTRPAVYDPGNLVVRWVVGPAKAGVAYSFEIDHSGAPTVRTGGGTMVEGANEFVVTGLPPGTDYRVCLGIPGWHYKTPLVITDTDWTLADFGSL